MGRTNLTFPTGLILQAIARGVRHGFDIIDATGLPGGTVYPALRRLEGAGFLASEWETDEEAEKRPPRCYYALTREGKTLLGQAIERFPAIPMAVTVGGDPAPGSTGSGSLEPGRA
jgi:DNA-binding PadR family transcriptional regulator